MRSTAGLTLLETIVAMGICGVILAALSTTTVSSLQESNQGNHKVQAVQVLDTIGRRIAGGLDDSLLLDAGASLALSGSEIDSLMGLSAFRDGAFSAELHNSGVFTLGSTRLSEYRIDVCYQVGSDERCVSGTTLGRRGGNS